MDKSTVATISSAVALAIYAAVDRSTVMFVSAVAIGLIVCLFRRARMRDRIIAVIAAALGGSLGAEIIRTLYQHLVVAESAADSGGYFMTAIVVGLINAAVICAVLITCRIWVKS